MEELSNQAKLLATNNIKTLDDLLDYKDDITYKINELSNQRERLWAIRKLSKDEEEMKKYAEQISTLTTNIDKLQKEVDECEDIKNRIRMIDNNLEELDKQEELEKETNDKKNKEKIENKDLEISERIRLMQNQVKKYERLIKKVPEDIIEKIQKEERNRKDKER